MLCLISGGGSALLPLPAEGLTLADEQQVNRALLRSGATIREMNCVRRHLSAIKGGRLAAACHPARVLTLLISDVPGDDPVDIASGPTVADPTTCDDALAIIRRYGIDRPRRRARDLLESGRGESVKPGDPRLANAETRLIATPQMALEAAATAAREYGVARAHPRRRHRGRGARGGQDDGRHRAAGRAPRPALRAALRAALRRRDDGDGAGSGRGGRNVEFLLALGIALDGHPGIHALAGDTDGVDGLEEIAGAYLAPDSLARARALGIRPASVSPTTTATASSGRWATP